MGCGCNNNFSGDNEPLINIPFDRGDKSNINLDMGNPIDEGSVPSRGNGLRKKQCTCGRNAGGNCQCNQRKLNAAGRNDFFLCPKGKCWNGKKCVPCTNGTPDGARQGRKPRKNLQQRIKSNKVKFSSFMGYTQNFPQVDTKKYGISDEHYYEFNSQSNVRTGINYNDIDVSF